MAMKLGSEGQEKHYIPEMPRVLYHTNLLQPHTSETIYFIAPISREIIPLYVPFPDISTSCRER